jgi:nucleoside-triphosphatase
LFLHGPRKTGKSSLLREILLPCRNLLAGFVTQRLMKDGELIGFRAELLTGNMPPLEAEYEPDMDGVFILRGKGEKSVLDDVIGAVEAACLKPACKLILLDEIGGIELASTVFMNALSRILSGTKPCIGVLKSKENLEHASSALGLDNRYLDLRARLEEQILRSGELMEYGPGSRRFAYARVFDYAARVAGKSFDDGERQLQ